MARSIPSWHVFVGLLAGLASASQMPVAVVTDPDAALPRYRLEVGREITYASSNDFKFEGGRFEVHKEWKIWVLRKNDDGSHRVVIRTAESFRRDGKDRPSAESPLVYCDIFSDGRFVPNPSLSAGIDPTYLFPRLPANRMEVASVWERIDENEGGRSSFRVVSNSETKAGAWIFEERRKSLTDEVRLRTHTRTVTFDWKRGLVTKERHEDTEGWGFKGKGNGTAELVSVEDRDAQWIKQLSEQAEHYFQADRAYKERIRQASRDKNSSKRLLDEAKALLVEARQAASVPIVKRQLDQQLKSHDDLAASLNPRRESPGRDRRTPSGRLGSSEPRGQAAFSQGVSGPDRDPRLLVSGLRLVHPGDASNQRVGGRLSGTTCGRARYEHRHGCSRRPVRRREGRAQLCDSQSQTGSAKQVRRAGLSNSGDHRPAGKCP